MHRFGLRKRSSCADFPYDSANQPRLLAFASQKVRKRIKPPALPPRARSALRQLCFAKNKQLSKEIDFEVDSKSERPIQQNSVEIIRIKLQNPLRF